MERTYPEQRGTIVSDLGEFLKQTDAEFIQQTNLALLMSTSFRTEPVERLVECLGLVRVQRIPWNSVIKLLATTCAGGKEKEKNWLIEWLKVDGNLKMKSVKSLIWGSNDWRVSVWVLFQTWTVSKFEPHNLLKHARCWPDGTGGTHRKGTYLLYRSLAGPRSDFAVWFSLWNRARMAKAESCRSPGKKREKSIIKTLNLGDSGDRGYCPMMLGRRSTGPPTGRLTISR